MTTVARMRKHLIGGWLPAAGWRWNRAGDVYYIAFDNVQLDLVGGRTDGFETLVVRQLIVHVAEELIDAACGGARWCKMLLRMIVTHLRTARTDARPTRR